LPHPFLIKLLATSETLSVEYAISLPGRAVYKSALDSNHVHDLQADAFQLQMSFLFLKIDYKNHK